MQLSYGATNMPLIADWNGNVLSTSSSEATWSNKGGIFKSSHGIMTYFPLPIAYRKAIPVVGTFIVPAAYKNRADLVAKHLYQSEDYWWLVFWMNGIIDPFAALNPGDSILVADLTSVNAILK